VTTTVSCPKAMLQNTTPQLRLEGWNIPTQTIPLATR